MEQEIVVGTRVGPPRQILSGPGLDQATPCTRTEKEPLHICIDDTSDARHVVDSLKAAGVDMLKMYELNKETYFAVAAEARRIGIPFGGHLHLIFKPQGITPLEASDSGATIVDHIHAGGFDTTCLGRVIHPEPCQLVADRFRKNGTWWVPTLMTMATLYGLWLEPAGGTRTSGPATGLWIRKAFGPASTATLKDFYGWASNFYHGSTQPFTLRYTVSTAADTDAYLRTMHRIGMPILAGTDVDDSNVEHQPPGFSLHTELALYVEEGLTPLEALQAATINPAKMLHGTDSLGTVAPGKLADMILLDADPLAEITNTTTIRAVMANGRYFDRATLDHLLREIQAKLAH